MAQNFCANEALFKQIECSKYPIVLVEKLIVNCKQETGILRDDVKMEEVGDEVSIKEESLDLGDVNYDAEDEDDVKMEEVEDEVSIKKESFDFGDVIYDAERDDVKIEEVEDEVSIKEESLDDFGDVNYDAEECRIQCSLVKRDDVKMEEVKDEVSIKEESFDFGDVNYDAERDDVKMEEVKDEVSIKEESFDFGDVNYNAEDQECLPTQQWNCDALGETCKDVSDSTLSNSNLIPFKKSSVTEGGDSSHIRSNNNFEMYSTTQIGENPFIKCTECSYC